MFYTNYQRKKFYTIYTIQSQSDESVDHGFRLVDLVDVTVDLPP